MFYLLKILEYDTDTVNTYELSAPLTKLIFCCPVIDSLLGLSWTEATRMGAVFAWERTTASEWDWEIA